MLKSVKIFAILFLVLTVTIVECKRGLEMEILLLKLLQNRSKKNQHVIPIPIYVPRARHGGCSAKSHAPNKYPVFVPMHVHEHHVMESSNLEHSYLPAPSPCQMMQTHRMNNDFYGFSGF
ncbi:uncharacterized protein LOC141856125 [Brevipalpus obovatus]|uniref:uncharacterized protein LOC141856125 n=1 Tax=Brevipalpus obovatus TaxID=246614 RepID=UPI003D9F92EE